MKKEARAQKKKRNKKREVYKTEEKKSKSISQLSSYSLPLLGDDGDPF